MSFTNILLEVLDSEIPTTALKPFARCWWTKELSQLKRKQNKLSNKSFKFRCIRDHLSHTDYREAVKQFRSSLDSTRNQHWNDWLESVSQQDIYVANKYITNEPTDFSSARVLALSYVQDGARVIADNNTSKAAALASSFFPPAPISTSVPPDTIYPRLLRGIKYFSRDRIRQVFKSLSPYKAPGPNGIPNVVYIKCVDVLIDHIFFIYRAVLELRQYHGSWRESITVVLCKLGKADHGVAKAYRPVGLLNTLGKGFNMLASRYVSFLCEKHNLLPAFQFGGRPGRNTSDAMLLITSRIKDAWCKGLVAAGIFLDVQGAFPNMVKDLLLHHMKLCRVPAVFVEVVELMLTDRFTKLRFDDFISDRMQINNGTTQGHPMSMLLYGFYNAPLIEVANSQDELSPGFVDDSMFLAVGATLQECHGKLKKMMERPGGGFKWSISHSSPFEISKVALMNWPRSHRDVIPGDLTLDRPNGDGSSTPSTVKTVGSYKYLGIIFDTGLRWTLHHAKVVANATFWASKVWRLAKVSAGMKAKGLRQLYLTVSVPGITYAVEVWYTAIYQPSGHARKKGSVAITNKLRSTQRKVAKTITGALATTAGDVLDIHAFLLPVDLMFRKVQFRAATRVCALPASHPLYKVVRRAASRPVKRHRSPLHNLLYASGLQPNEVETITPSCRSPGYRPVFRCV